MMYSAAVVNAFLYGRNFEFNHTSGWFSVVGLVIVVTVVIDNQFGYNMVGVDCRG